MAEDFLYHLYRGSELLADGRYVGAREELDRALRKQPRDAAAQDLLAKVYFRLGLYPRAIELYLDVVKQFPERIPPRINLALAYLKTGQMRDTVTQLLPVIEREPGHVKAWGYLGLAWSRLSEHAKAREAFARAGHEGMARRMDEILAAQYAPLPVAEPVPVERPVVPVSVPGAASLAWEEEGGPDVGGAVDDLVDGSPLDANALAVRLAVAPRGDVLELDEGALIVVAGCAVRAGDDAIRIGALFGEAVARQREHIECIGGAPAMIWLRAGWIVLPAVRAEQRTVLTLDEDGLVVRESALEAFDGTLEHDRFEAPVDALELRGPGRVALRVGGALRVLSVTAETPVDLPISALVAWRGAVYVRGEGSRAVLTGEGTVWISLPRASSDV